MHEAAHPFAERRLWLEEGSTGVRIELRGALPVRWCTRLTSHLAARGLGVRSIVATRVRGGRWTASVELMGDPADPVLGALDTLVDREVATAPARAALLTRLEVESATDHEGSILVRFLAPDRVGLLATVFDALSLYTLFPAAIEAHTSGGLADDRLWLKGLGNAPLGGRIDEARVREALAALFAGATR